ncbi:MAG: NUDIX hydrolase [Candidatus Komeilibacteria bacterium]
MSRLIVSTISALRCDGKYIFVQRKDLMFNGGLWEFPGGKVKNLRDIKGEALREVHEEVLGKYEVKNFHQLSEFTIDSTNPEYPDYKIRFIIFVGDIELPLVSQDEETRVRSGDEHQNIALLDTEEVEHLKLTKEAKRTLMRFKKRAPA